MDLKALRYFTAIVEHGGFAKAAEQVHLSQPALSKAVLGLEAELNITLLERGRRGAPLRLTPAGDIVYQHALQLLAGRQRLHQDLQRLKGLEFGHISIGLPPLGSAALFAPIIARFRARYPNIEITLLERGGVTLLTALHNGEVDLALSVAPDDDHLEWLEIRNDPMMVALPNDHPLSQHPVLRLTDLAGTALVTFEESFVLGTLIHNECLHAGFEPQGQLRVSHVDFGLALVASGAGAMLLPRLVTEHLTTPGVRLIPLDSATLRWRPSVIWRKKTTLSPAAQAMMQLVRERFACAPNPHA